MYAPTHPHSHLLHYAQVSMPVPILYVLDYTPSIKAYQHSAIQPDFQVQVDWMLFPVLQLFHILYNKYAHLLLCLFLEERMHQNTFWYIYITFLLEFKQLQ